jgi:small-conductance mechanosensitive channel
MTPSPPCDPSTEQEQEPTAPGQQQRLKALLAELSSLSQELANQPEALVNLLRQLEQLHRQIQDGPLRGSLPADRHKLFELLQNLEQSGGWPYIPRPQLHNFLRQLQQQPAEAPETPEHQPPRELK